MEQSHQALPLAVVFLWDAFLWDKGNVAVALNHVLAMARMDLQFK